MAQACVMVQQNLESGAHQQCALTPAAPTSIPDASFITSSVRKRKDVRDNNNEPNADKRSKHILDKPNNKQTIFIPHQQHQQDQQDEEQAMLFSPHFHLHTKEEANDIADNTSTDASTGTSASVDKDEDSHAGNPIIDIQLKILAQATTTTPLATTTTAAAAHRHQQQYQQTSVAPMSPSLVAAAHPTMLNHRHTATTTTTTTTRITTASITTPITTTTTTAIIQQQHQQEEEEDEDDLLDFDPYLFIRRLPSLHECITPRTTFLLPKQTRRSKKKTLVLDLDETLVHSTLDGECIPDFTFPVQMGPICHMVAVRKRPHLKTFLDRVAELFEVVVFTASQQIYAEQLLDVIDPGRKRIRHRIYRDSCVLWEGNYLKDLTVLGRDLAHTLIIDNSPQAFGFQLDNGVPIESWYDDDDDTELIKMLPFLERLADADDVRPMIAREFNLRKIVDAMPLGCTV